MPNYPPIADFSGGLNTRDGAGGIADNEVAENKNCYLVGRNYAKRKGFARHTGSSKINGTEEGTSLTDIHFVTAGQKVVGTAGSKIAWDDSGTWTDITGSVSLTAEIPVITTKIEDNLVGVNGTNPAWYWSGAGDAITLEKDGIPTAPTTCETFKNRLFLAEGRNLYWSDFLDFNKDFNPTSQQPFNSKIIGLRVLGDSLRSILMIFCEHNGVYVCTFDPDTTSQAGGRGVFTFDQISEQHGCASAASVKECFIPNIGLCIIWADFDGLKIYSPAFGVEKITDKIQPDWESLDFANISYFTGTYYRPKNWYIFNCRESGSAANDKQIIVDLYNSNPGNPDPDRRWVIGGLFDLPVSVFGTIKESGVEKLIGSDYSGYWNQYDNGQNDNTVAIDAFFKTKSFDGDYSTYNKAFMSVELQYAYFGQFEIDVKAFYDYTGGTYSVTHTAKGGATLDKFILDQDILGISGQLAIVGQEIKGHGRSIQLRIGNDEVDQPFRIHSLKPNYRAGRPVLFE